MKLLRDTQFYDGKLLEDEFFSFDDDIISSNKPTTSSFTNYCFSADEDTLFTSVDSLYIDDSPIHMPEQQEQPDPPRWALEELLTTPAPEKTYKPNRSRSSPTMLEPSRGNHTSFSDGEHYVWELSGEDSDDEHCEFDSDCSEASPSLARTSLFDKSLALTIRVEEKNPRAPRKKRAMDALALTQHPKIRQEDCSSSDTQRSKQRVLDALSITLHSMRREAKSTRKSKKDSLLKESDATADQKVKRSSSLKSSMSPRLSLDASTKKERKRGSLSKPKRSKKKSSFDLSSHSTTDGDDKKESSASVSRRKKGSKR